MARRRYEVTVSGFDVRIREFHWGKWLPWQKVRESNGELYQEPWSIGGHLTGYMCIPERPRKPKARSDQSP